MTSKVRIIITIPPCYDVPSGVYHDEEFVISDLQWQNMRSALMEFEVELMSMSPQSLQPKASEKE